MVHGTVIGLFSGLFAPVDTLVTGSGRVRLSPIGKSRVAICRRLFSHVVDEPLRSCEIAKEGSNPAIRAMGRHCRSSSHGCQSPT